MDNGKDARRPVLPTSDELKGKRASSAKRSGKKWLVPLLLILILGALWAVLNYTDVLKQPEPEATVAPSIAVTLLEHGRADLDRLTISGKDIAAYTLINNNEYDEEGNVIRETPSPEDAATPSPSPAEPEVAVETEATDKTAPDAEPQAVVGPQAPAIVETALDQEYSVEGEPYFAVNTSPVATMHVNATALNATDTVPGAQDLSAFGLQQPALTVTAHYKDGTQSTLLFGDKTPVGNGYYLQMQGSDAVYTVSTAAFTAFNKTLASLHTVSMPGTADAASLQSLLIEQSGKDTVEVRNLQDEKSVSISSLKLVQPLEYDAHSTRAPELATAVASVQLSGYLGHASGAEQLAPYGLNPPRAYVRLEDTNGGTMAYWVGDPVDELYTAVAVDQTGDVYKVETATLAYLKDASAAHLVDQFSNLVNIEKVDQLRVQAQDEQFPLSIERQQVAKDDGTQETVATYLFDGEAKEEKLFKGLYQDIIGLMFDKMRPQNDQQPLGDVICSVRYQLNNGRDDIVVEYLAYDSDYYAVRQNGSALFLIKHNKVQTMIEKCRQFRDGTYERS